MDVPEPENAPEGALADLGIFDGAALNLVGFYGTQGFWKTYDCENGGEGPDFFYNAGAYMYSNQFPPFLGNDPITQALMEAGVPEETIALMMGGNALRFLSERLPSR